RVPAALQHRPAAPCPRPARTGSSRQPATADQPRRAPDTPETSPRRTHTRIPDRRLTSQAFETTQVTALIVYSSPTGSRSGRADEKPRAPILAQPAHPAKPQVTAPAASSEAVPAVPQKPGPGGDGRGGPRPAGQEPDQRGAARPVRPARARSG